MPLFDFVCRHCKKQHEVLVHSGSRSAPCPDEGCVGHDDPQALEREGLGYGSKAPSAQFKGSGWARDGYSSSKKGTKS